MNETARLTNEWLQDSPTKDVCFKAIILMPKLLLQKPSTNFKTKDHLPVLERILKLRKKGELERRSIP